MRSIVLVAGLCLAVASTSEAQRFHTAPPNAPSRGAIGDSTERGTRMVVSGRVLGSDGKPIAGASIYAYQTDANGEYVPNANGGGSDRPRLFTYMRSDAEGRYSFTTIRPGSYPNSRNPGHIHFEIAAPGRENRVYEIVFEGDPYISEAFRAQARVPLGGVEIVTTRPTSRGWLEVSHDIRIK